MSEIAYLALGSNLGNRAANLKAAIIKLHAHRQVQAVDQSQYYQTAPRFNTDQPQFLNAVLSISTDLSPLELLEFTSEIEVQAGRQKARVKNQPRTLDIDILTYGDEIISLKRLKIPHPGLAERRFVLEPWCEIAPEFRVAGTTMTIRNLLAACNDNSMAEVYLMDPVS